ncbi:MAG TPA: phosphate acyltransferase PlsX [Alphaproteobacteria bacterium]|nr:phosphate acyltransferase PlsX [Alphaproteobacteria bacterium]
MAPRLTIAVDAMGGDQAPGMVIRGLGMAHKRHPEAHFLVYGDERLVTPLLRRRFKKSPDSITLHHTSERVADTDKPSVALRAGRNTSMRLAIDAVADGKASGVVSAGNTGALMVMSKMVLKTLEGIDRPAIASMVPTMRGEGVMLDLGANIQCDANNLVQFALMGDVFARTVLGIEKPSVGILNVGEEDLKGHEILKEAAAMLRDPGLPISFQGFVEGNDIWAGNVDVAVTDGFTGNVALKTAEGVARLYAGMVRLSFRSSLLARLGYLLARPGLAKFRNRVDPRRYNGAMFLGLNGIAIKSHGGTDAFGFANAISVAVDMVAQGFNQRIIDDLKRFSDSLNAPRKAAI